MKNTILFLLGIGGAIVSFAQSYLPSPTSLTPGETKATVHI